MSKDTGIAILDILAGSAKPLTTAQIRHELQAGAPVGDIYAILFLMQSSGLIECSVSCPWKWNRVGREDPSATNALSA